MQKIYALKGKLVTLFKLGQVDVDISICRHMNAHREELDAFLEHGLPPQIRRVLAECHSNDKAEAQRAPDPEVVRLEPTRMDPGISPKTQALQVQHELAGADTHTAEREIYGHLCRFFRRYYTEDKASKRHWRNYSWHTIQTIKYYRDYIVWFPIGEIQFKTVGPSSEQGDIKFSNDKNRRFMLREDQPVIQQYNHSTIYLEHRVDDQKRSQHIINKEVAERISGCLKLLGHAVSTARVRHWLEEYSIRGIFDHEGAGFLRRELDYYIEQEVPPLGDGLSDQSRHLVQIQRFRHIGHKLIDVLSQAKDLKQALSGNNPLAPVIDFKENFGGREVDLQEIRMFDNTVSNQPFGLIHIPKNMSTSLAEMWGYTIADEFCFSEVEPYGHRTIVVIRDPFHRAVSGFFHLAKTHRYDICSAETIQTKWHEVLSVDVKNSFNLFLDYIEGRFYNVHIFPQHEFLSSKGLTLSDIDYVLLQESIESGIDKLNKILGFNAEFRHDSLFRIHSTSASNLALLDFFHLGLRTMRRIYYFLTHPRRLVGVIHNIFMGFKPAPLTVTQLQYSTLRDYVENDPQVRARIQKIYHQDFVLYEEARARAL